MVDARENREETGFYFSAFVSALVDTRNRVNKAANADQAIKAIKDTWEGSLTPEEKELYLYFVGLRNKDTHEYSVGAPGGALKTEFIFIVSDERIVRYTVTDESTPLPQDLGGEARPTYVLQGYQGGTLKLIPCCLECYYLLKLLVDAAEPATAMLSAG